MRQYVNFTLIELLVVIAIIAILAGLLVGPMVKSVDSGRMTSCTNLVKQYELATQQYSADNDGMLIDSYNYLSSSGGMPQYMNNSASMNDTETRCPNDSFTHDMNRMFTNNTTTAEFFQNAENKDVQISIGVVENTLSASRRPTAVGPHAFWNKIGAIKNPSRAGVWTDFQNPDGSTLTAPIARPSGNATSPLMYSLVFRHNEGTASVMAFADGHVGKITIGLSTINNGHDLDTSVTQWGSEITNSTVGKFYKGYEPFFGPTSVPITTAYGVYPGITID